MEDTKHYVIIMTRSGIFGEALCSDNQQECIDYVAELRRRIAEEPKGMTRFDPPGFGFGAPCPLNAISDIVILGPDEELPESWFGKHLAHAEKFAEGIAKGAK